MNSSTESEKSPPGNRTASNDCLPYEKRDNYFLTAVVSAGLAVVSAGVAVVSGAGAAGAGAAVVSAFCSVDSVELLQATKAPIANTNKSFFMLPMFVLLTIDLVLILKQKEGNPVTQKKFIFFCETLKIPDRPFRKALFCLFGAQTVPASQIPDFPAKMSDLTVSLPKFAPSSLLQQFYSHWVTLA